MIRVHIRSASGSLSERLVTADPVEAEAHYLRLVQRRTEAPVAVILHAQEPGIILPARYRLDTSWPADVHREDEQERRETQWLRGPPTPAMIRALGKVAGLSGRMAAEIAGLDSGRTSVDAGRTWRRWIAGDSRMPPATYWWILVTCGLHPDPGFVSICGRSRSPASATPSRPLTRWGRRQRGSGSSLEPLPLRPEVPGDQVAVKCTPAAVAPGRRSCGRGSGSSGAATPCSRAAPTLRGSTNSSGSATALGDA